MTGHTVYFHEFRGKCLAHPDVGLLRDRSLLCPQVSVKVGGRHIQGSPYSFHATHQFAVSILPGSEVVEPRKALDRRFAYVTLVANDDFVNGALVLADSLER